MSPNSLTAPSFGPWHLDFPSGSGADRVGAGIDFVRRALAEWHVGGHPLGLEEAHAMDIVLVAAELLGNAERHGGGTRSLDVERHAGLLRLTVCDRSPLPPRPVRPHRPERAGGHGLHIVDRLSAHWGWRPHESGKAVWAELPPPAPGGG